VGNGLVANPPAGAPAAEVPCVGAAGAVGAARGAAILLTLPVLTEVGAGSAVGTGNAVEIGSGVGRLFETPASGVLPIDAGVAGGAWTAGRDVAAAPLDAVLDGAANESGATPAVGTALVAPGTAAAGRLTVGCAGPPPARP
jgi:hypothetical protein